MRWWWWARWSLARDAGLDEAMGLIGGHEDFVRIVLAEAGKVNEQAVLIGHGEVDVGHFGRVVEDVLRHGVEGVLDGFGLMFGEGGEEKLANVGAEFGERQSRRSVGPVGTDRSAEEAVAGFGERGEGILEKAGESRARGFEN